MARRRITQGVIESGLKRHAKALDAGKYEPWHKVADVPSEGRSREAYGKTEKRIHHLLSDIEYRYFLHLDFSDLVIGIYEQYPLLPIEHVEDIARSLGIKHLNYPGTKITRVLTCDFLVEIQDQASGEIYWIARSIKSSEALLPTSKSYQSVLNTLEIEKAFFKLQDIDWKLVTEESLNPVVTQNLEWIGKDIRENSFTIDNYREFLEHFTSLVVDGYVVNLKKAFQQIAMRMKCPFEEVNRLFRYSVWFKYLIVDLSLKPINLMTELDSVIWEINESMLDQQGAAINA